MYQCLGNILQYADDIMVLIKGMTVVSVRAKTSEAYEVLQDWFLRNRLKLNSQKTHFMYIMTSQRAAGKMLDEPVKFGNDYVVPSMSERVLGVTLGTNLSLDAHLFSAKNSIFQQVSSKMRALWLLKKHLSFKTRKMTAWGLVMSRILYGIEVWGPSATEKQLNKMQVLQNSILRWICSARRGTRNRDLLDMTGMMSIRQLVYYRVLMFGLKALWNNEPVAMSGWREPKVRRLKITSRSFRFVFGKLMSKCI